MAETFDAYDHNVLGVEVETNCPQGGDSGHGGYTSLVLRDEGGTDIEVSVLGGGKGVRIELGGDAECATFIQCLRFAADALERQWLANGGRADRLMEAPTPQPRSTRTRYDVIRELPDDENALPDPPPPRPVPEDDIDWDALLGDI